MCVCVWVCVWVYVCVCDFQATWHSLREKCVKGDVGKGVCVSKKGVVQAGISWVTKKKRGREGGIVLICACGQLES